MKHNQVFWNALTTIGQVIGSAAILLRFIVF